MIGKIIVLSGLAGILLSGSARADYLDDIGYTGLQLQLGGSIPTGEGVKISQIEAPISGTDSSNYVYIPDSSAAEFASTNFTIASGGSTSASWHATMVGKLIYGSNAMASGIEDVQVYEANYFLNSILNRGVSGSAPVVETNDIQNHSWVGSVGASDAQVLRRVDYAIQRDDFVSVVGVNNGVGAEQNLLSSAYNVIGVGVSSGNHSAGVTTVNGAGRQVVHLVVPVGTTSEATAVVSSAAALLIEEARVMGSANGEKSETIKATLLAGATKTGLSGWERDSTTQPLDETYGAGQLNIQNSYNILSAGEQSIAPSTHVASTGWDNESVTSASSQTYYFQLSDPSSLSIALTWNVTFAESIGNYNTMAYDLSNLSLRLYSASGFALGSLVDASLSNVDNVEYIWQQYLEAGDYAIVASSSDSNSKEYSVAWQATAVPEPSTYVLLGLGLGCIGFAASRKRFPSRN